MNTYPKCTETANSYQLWEEYVDPQGLMSEAEFEARHVCNSSMTRFQTTVIAR